jgi:hypothetical protein
VTSTLQELVENIEVLQNSVPRSWASLEPFKGRTEEVSGNRLGLFPHIGAFEIYHRDTLLYSKLSCRLWPNCKVVAKKIAAYFQDVKGNGDINKYAVNYKHPAKNKSILYGEE